MARVENLIPDRLIGVECLTCGHLTTIPALLVKAKLRATTFVMTLSRHLRCDRCGERNARVVVGWALGIVDHPLASVTPEVRGRSGCERRNSLDGRSSMDANRHGFLLRSALRYAFVMPQAPSVLIVEDEREVRELIAEVLTMAGYRLFVAEDGAEAARLSETDQAIDLLLTDVRMPSLDGFALAERFVRARPTGKVLYLTGFPDQMQRAEDPRLHGKMLWKPFRPSELLVEVETTLGSTRR